MPGHCPHRRSLRRTSGHGHPNRDANRESRATNRIANKHRDPNRHRSGDRDGHANGDRDGYSHGDRDGWAATPCAARHHRGTAHGDTNTDTNTDTDADHRSANAGAASDPTATVNPDARAHARERCPRRGGCRDKDCHGQPDANLDTFTYPHAYRSADAATGSPAAGRGIYPRHPRTGKRL
ncbi:MAG: hypothetical protein AMXMBFR80_24280 [Dehalococcoidia bacterium]